VAAGLGRQEAAQRVVAVGLGRREAAQRAVATGLGVPGGGLEDGVRDERVAKAVNSGIFPCFRD
jgi:hypothetical protein